MISAFAAFFLDLILNRARPWIVLILIAFTAGWSVLYFVFIFPQELTLHRALGEAEQPLTARLVALYFLGRLGMNALSYSIGWAVLRPFRRIE